MKEQREKGENVQIKDGKIIPKKNWPSPDTTNPQIDTLLDQTKSEKPPIFTYPFIFSHNINGIYSKFIEFSYLINNVWSNISIINLQETKLKAETSTSTIDLTEFHTLRLDRDLTNFKENGGGGLLTYINKKWCPNKPKLITQISNPDA